MFDPLAWDELWIPEEPEEDEDDKIHQNSSLKYLNFLPKTFFPKGQCQNIFLNVFSRAGRRDHYLASNGRGYVVLEWIVFCGE